MDLHTPVTVPVERDGEYQVSIFAIREGMGILGSGVGYTELVMVLTPPMESTTPSLMPGNYDEETIDTKKKQKPPHKNNTTTTKNNNNRKTNKG